MMRSTPGKGSKTLMWPSSSSFGPWPLKLLTDTVLNFKPFRHTDRCGAGKTRLPVIASLQVPSMWTLLCCNPHRVENTCQFWSELSHRMSTESHCFKIHHVSSPLAKNWKLSTCRALACSAQSLG